MHDQEWAIGLNEDEYFFLMKMMDGIQFPEPDGLWDRMEACRNQAIEKGIFDGHTLQSSQREQ